MLASVLHLCCPCFVIFSHFISQSFFRYLPYEPSFVLFLLSIITSSVHSFRLAIVCSVSVWNLFRLRHVQASSSSRLTFHFTGSSIMYYDHKRWMKKDRCTWKSHCLLVPQNVTCYRFHVIWIWIWIGTICPQDFLDLICVTWIFFIDYYSFHD